MSSSPHGPDVSGMLAYAGPSTRQQAFPAEGVTIADLVDSDHNERAVDRLLSSRGIPFAIERPELGWTGIRRRMLVTVEKGRQAAVYAILNAAAEAGVLEMGTDDEGLSW